MPLPPDFPDVPELSPEERTVGRLLAAATEGIARAGSATPRLDALLLLEDALRRTPEAPQEADRTWLSAHPEPVLEQKTAAVFRRAVLRRRSGLPVAYITGRKWFWKYEFLVTPDVLIPKPDTETLVERAEEILTILCRQNPAAGGVTLLDMCTGSGCIVLSLKAGFPGVQAAGADISPQALAVAEQNAARLLPAGSVRFFRHDLRDGFPPPDPRLFPDAPVPAESRAGWSLITANPPYVPTEQAGALLSDGRAEPLLALDGGPDGLSLIRPLVRSAFDALEPGGYLLIETGEYNADAAAACFREAGFFAIFVREDLAGQKRLVEGRRPESGAINA